ncbi:MAG TPA: hypothetical protein PLK37_11450, partial [Terricaulis sp.]|nr:hypothetical protein [Terricaulis sp.]
SHQTGRVSIFTLVRVSIFMRAVKGAGVLRREEGGHQREASIRALVTCSPRIANPIRGPATDCRRFCGQALG